MTPTVLFIEISDSWTCSGRGYCQCLKNATGCEGEYLNSATPVSISLNKAVIFLLSYELHVQTTMEVLGFFLCYSPVNTIKDMSSRSVNLWKLAKALELHVTCYCSVNFLFAKCLRKNICSQNALEFNVQKS